MTGMSGVSVFYLGGKRSDIRSGSIFALYRLLRGPTRRGEAASGEARGRRGTLAATPPPDIIFWSTPALPRLPRCLVCLASRQIFRVLLLAPMNLSSLRLSIRPVQPPALWNRAFKTRHNATRH